jgi:tetratricopeptide (TPR) repeat protein
MNCRVLAAFVLVIACRTAAFAAPPDDTGELAEGLIAQGWPDLAQDLLARAARERALTWSEEAITASAHLVTLETAAKGIEDPLWRKEALLDLLAQTDTFVGRFEGTTAAATRRSDLPDLVADIGEAIVAAIRMSQDAGATEALRIQGESIFARAEKEVKARIDLLAAAENRDEDQDFGLMAAQYNHARLLYLHATVFPRDSARRKELCAAALGEYEEFDLEYADTIFNIYAYVDMGLCLRELGKTDAALAQFDQAIAVRESWGPMDERGHWPIPAEAGDVVDLVCYATAEKMIELREQKKLDDVVKTGRDWFASMPKPFSAPSSMALAWELGNAQLATGDASGAAATAQSMIDEDPDGFGAELGRELLGRIAN